MDRLFLEDLKDLDLKEIYDHIRDQWYSDKNFDADIRGKYDILIAYESVGSWGCDSTGFFLLRGKKDKKLYEVHGSHCSCNGFEDQFEPEETSLEYLQSDKFSVGFGGYDSNSEENHKTITEYIKRLKK